MVHYLVDKRDVYCHTQGQDQQSSVQNYNGPTPHNECTAGLDRPIIRRTPPNPIDRVYPSHSPHNGCSRYLASVYPSHPPSDGCNRYFTSLDCCNTCSPMDVRVYPRGSCHRMPSLPIDSGVVDFTPHQHQIPPSASLLGGPAFGTPRALMRLVGGVFEDILCWRGGGDQSRAVDGTPELTEDDLFFLGLVEGYFDAILESHEQLMCSLRWEDRFREGACGPNTQGAQKHPAWDCFSDTSPEGWMEFDKSLRCNAINFGIVLITFEASDMMYRDKGHGLCFCGLGIHRCWLWVILSSVSFNSSFHLVICTSAPSWNPLTMICTMDLSSYGCYRSAMSPCLTLPRSLLGWTGTATSSATPRESSCTAI